MQGDGFVLRGRVFDGMRFLPDGFVEVREGRIAALGQGPHRAGPVEDCSGCWILPGFIDIHVHGALGFDFADADAASAGRVARYLLSRGTTGFAATILSSEHETTLTALSNLRALAQGDPAGSAMIGVHFEGPFLSPAARGAHLLEHLRAPDPGLADEMLAGSPAGLLRWFTIAPELPGAIELIRHLLERGARVGLGHSKASYEETLHAMSLGVSHATHLFNAMGALHHRRPGMIGAFLDIPEATVEVIPDGIHLHPAILRMVMRLKGPTAIVAVTDACPAAGLPDGVYHWQERPVQLRGGGAYLEDGTLAGSMLDFPTALQVMEASGIAIETALRTMTEMPARLSGTWESRGSLAPGKRADIVVMTPDKRVDRTYLEGRLVQRDMLAAP